MSPRPARIKGAPRCILVVDDEEDVRDTVKDLIETCVDATRVRTAGSGLAGLDILREEKGAVDLIITDFRMPGMDGQEFLLQAGKVAPDTPTVMVTAYDLPKSAAPPGSHLMHKPLHPEAFLGMVERALADWGT